MFPVIETTVHPCALERAGRICQRPFSIRLAVYKHPLNRPLITGSVRNLVGKETGRRLLLNAAATCSSVCRSRKDFNAAPKPPPDEVQEAEGD